MNTLIKYVSGLIPVLSKNRVMEDLRLAYTTFDDCKDAYKRALDQMPGKFKTASLNEFSKQYASLARGGSGKNILDNIYNSLPDVLASIELLETVVSGELQDVEAAQGLDYKKANLIQLADALNFASRYCVKVLSHCANLELATVRLENKLEPDPVTELDIYTAEKLQANLQAFASVMSIMSAPKTVSEKLASIPDILLTENNFGILKNTIGKASIEPFDLTPGKSLNFSWSPLYHRGIAVANAKHARAEEAKAELQIVRVRMYQLENSAKGKDDAGVQQQVNVLRQKCSRLTRDIEKAEQ